ncbi:MAG: glutathione synthase [Gammaproteobacteria bacterium]|nr:glutathione synthase [Gammaproteobacteria bacterium]
MSRQLAVIMDPLAGIKGQKDTTVGLLREGARRGYEIHYAQPGDLSLRDGRVQMTTQRLDIGADDHAWYTLGASATLTANDLDVVLMRKDPPFDMEYIYTTYLLELLERDGVLVVNRPQSLRDANEKLFATWFADVAPPTLVTRRQADLRAFLGAQGDIVVKPLDGMGGTSVFHVKTGDPNATVIFETMTSRETRFVMAQRYLPEIAAGDKRILVIDGEPVPYALARIPAPGETRGNLAAGGHGEGRPLSPADKRIAARVGPVLRAKGLLFVGLDVIGDHLTEINVTSPTGMRELDKTFSLNIAARLFDAIETGLEAGH